MKNSIFLLFLFLMFFSNTKAHENLLVRIKEKTKQISQQPKNALLYYERGYLYQQHFEYKNAIKDYKKSKKLGFNHKLLDYRKAKSFLELGKPKKALFFIKSYYKKDSTNINVHKLEAQVLFKLKRYKESLSAYEYVIKHTIDVRPNDIILYSEAFLISDKENYKEAIKIIDSGLEKLGKNTIVLQLKKLEYLKKSNRSNEAIELYNSIILNNTRKEYWYFKKAVYLFEIEKLVESNIALQQAKTSIFELKLQLQNTVSMKKLLDDIHILDTKINL